MLKAVEKKAKRVGANATDYVRSLIERDLLADQTFDEILLPIREDFRKSKIGEAELEQIIERARTAGQSSKKKSRNTR